MEQTKRFKVALLALVAALALCLGMTTTAFAAEDDATAALTKQLVVGEGTTLPADGITFTFEFEGITGTAPVAPGETAPALKEGPAIAPVTATVTAASLNKTDAGLTTYSQETAVLGITGDMFTAAGVYGYKVTENQVAAYTQDDKYKETITYDQGSYTMYVWVGNDPDTGEPYIKDITFGDDEAGGEKVDGTPGGGGEEGNGIDGNGDGDADCSGVGFENTYVKTLDEEKIDTDDPSTYALDVNKTVTGDMGDLTKEFAFSITVTKPANELFDAISFTAFKVDADGNSEEVTITYGAAYSFTLAHGEKLVLGDVYFGSTYDVSEVEDEYTPSYVVTNGDAGDGNAVTGQKIPDSNNTASFTNDLPDVTPTGIIMNNLPFFMLILVAVGALVAFVVAKSRKAQTTI